jgi:hypothetical protein
VSAPRYLPAFFVSDLTTGGRTRIQVLEVGPAGDPGDVIACAEYPGGVTLPELSFFADADLIVPVFSWRLRELDAFDVFDERGEAIGYFRADRLSAPYLDAVGTTDADGRVEYRDDPYPVLSCEPRSSVGVRSVTVPDRRLSLRLAAAIATELGTRRL